MSPQEWEKVSELFQAARAKTGGEQIALLDSGCSDSALRQMIEQMLRNDEAASSFLDQPVLHSFAASASTGSTIVFSTGLLPGAKFGHYEILAPIGRGGMGEVWMGRDLELDRPVALKFLARAATLTGAMDQLTREARSASALNHPNIITIHEIVRHHEISILVMELVDGAALRTLCGTPQPLNRVIHVGAQVARALAAAHAHGIVHHDIKPENVLVRQDGYVKVLDFGLARRVGGAETGSNQLFAGGTFRYMSPEQARAESISPASDVFSLGLVLYELTTGRHAFPSDSQFGTVCTMLTKEPAAPSSLNPRVPSRLDSLILATLSKSPEKRPSSREVARRLEELEAHTKVARAWFSSTWIWVSGTCLLMAVIAIWLLTRPGNLPQFANLRIEPLTSQNGWESGPTLSPDGASVAFAWAPNLETSPQIYVKRNRDSAPVRITDARVEGIIQSPAWSPDGKWIAFKREFKWSSNLSVVPSAGGAPEKKLVDLKSMHLAHAIDWSPDGRKLAFSDLVPLSTRLGIYWLDVRTGEKRLLTTPPSMDFADWDPKFSPDGRTVAFKRVHGFWDDAIYTVPVSGGQARQALTQSGGIWGHAWSGDGKSLILSCQRGTSIFGLWRFPIDGRGPPERIIQGGADAITPAISRKTGRLAWVNLTEDVNIHRIAASGEQPPQPLIASTARDRDAAYSPNGRIAFISDRSGTREIWLALADGSNQHRVTNFNGPDIDNLAWSSDGRSLAFYARLQGRSDIFVLDCDPANSGCGDPKLKISGMKAEVPSWSHDDRFLYFASDRTGRFEVWRGPASGGRPIQITHAGGFMARESSDGKWLYFSKNGAVNLWRMRLESDQPDGTNTEEMIIGPPFNIDKTSWVLTRGEVFFTQTQTNEEPGSLRAYSISTGATRVILPSLPSFADSRDYSITVSPDSKSLLYSQLDRSGSNIMVADNR
jgi:Tol biopolymer transport system component